MESQTTLNHQRSSIGSSVGTERSKGNNLVRFENGTDECNCPLINKFGDYTYEIPHDMVNLSECVIRPASADENSMFPGAGELQDIGVFPDCGSTDHACSDISLDQLFPTIHGNKDDTQSGSLNQTQLLYNMEPIASIFKSSDRRNLQIMLNSKILRTQIFMI